MTLEKRLEKLEQQAQGQIKEYILCDMNGKPVEAEIIQKPTLEADGLARLTDGSELPVEYRDGGLSSMPCVLISTPKPGEEKLLYIPSDAVLFIGAPEGFFDGVEEW